MQKYIQNQYGVSTDNQDEHIDLIYFNKCYVYIYAYSYIGLNTDLEFGRMGSFTPKRVSPTKLPNSGGVHSLIMQSTFDLHINIWLLH